ncbi:FecR family protein [Novosphingobium mangrovi (ex Huang et al. 2023)]|uniref:FecR domain-containing protein n=1 Tax=Novosphingobium mangrovi (ex Huang et al. 2023) TaxID=2976432 RepID=A0ABT2I1Y0_9SPHN|nr:FecR domain-containing protein [Novosphingobium mangrovi (ex Huang et al. 2023)]MCT2398813.1 FecR domain-containing protein [Novosphingobium mangrovi (ex Huang et al. 2023)]
MPSVTIWRGPWWTCIWRSRKSKNEAALSENSSIEFQAAEWIERRTGGEPFDETAFQAWLAADPGRQPVFDAMWRHIMGSDMNAALRAYDKRGASGRNLAVGGLAALLVVAGGYKATPSVELYFAQPREYAVAGEEVREIRLEDGTRLFLAGGADVKVRYTRHDRVVELGQGTIFAKVAHDEGRPFRVDTGEARIVDIGTSFEVLSKPGEIRVSVASGVVRFGRSGWFDKPIELIRRQSATLDRTGLKRTADVSPDNVARWRSEWVEYKGTPLRQVIADLQTLSPLPIRIADESLANKLVGGRIRLTDPVGQLQNLAIIYEFQVRRSDNGLIVSKN